MFKENKFKLSFLLLLSPIIFHSLFSITPFHHIAILLLLLPSSLPIFWYQYFLLLHFFLLLQPQQILLLLLIRALLWAEVGVVIVGVVGRSWLGRIRKPAYWGKGFVWFPSFFIILIFFILFFFFKLGMARLTHFDFWLFVLLLLQWRLLNSRLHLLVIFVELFYEVF